LTARVIDASVAAKWFFAEKGSAEAQRLVESESVLVAPDLLIPETCNIAWKKFFVDDATAEQAAAVAAHLPNLVDQIVPSRHIAGRAVEIAMALAHPAYDCFYLALAELADCRLITADARFGAKVAGTAWAERVRLLGA
jgi:predicted nucleic acid-binding protein